MLRRDVFYTQLSRAVHAYERARDIKLANEKRNVPLGLNFRLLWDDLDSLRDYGVEPVRLITRAHWKSAETMVSDGYCCCDVTSVRSTSRLS